MAKHAAVQRYLAINGTAISPYCRSIEITDEKDNVEVTGFTTAGYKEYVTAFADATITVELFAEFDTANGVIAGSQSIHTLLQPLYASGGTFNVEVRETQAAVSATNPKATMVAKLYAYSPIAGGVGDAAAFTAAMRNAGTAGLQWATS
jgi:hypothetical protein